MSVKSSAGWTQLFITNANRENNIPPMVFPGLSSDPSQHFSYCVWVRITAPRIPAPLIMHNCMNGSFMKVMTDGFRWQMDARNTSVGLPTQQFASVLYGYWTLICVSKSGPRVTIYTGTQDSFEMSNPWEHPVDLTTQVEFDYDFNDPFGYFAVILTNGSDVCNFKFWNQTLTKDQFQTQANTWVPTGTPAPIWASPLRTAGDIGNIANPSCTVNWTYEHYWSSIDPSPANIITAGSLGAWNDPAYLAFSQPCPTWVYPIDFPVQVPPLGIGGVSVNPGMTPALSPFTYKSTVFFSYADKGSIPHVDSSIQSIVHYAAPFKDGTLGPVPSDSWGLYKDELGVEISPNFGDPTQRFEQDSGVVAPSGIKATNMYKWKYSGQFTWQPTGAPIPSGTGGLIHQLLYITYTGFPTGLLALSDIDLSGLFILSKKPPRADTYHNQTSLKIPDPVVRTALIGE